MDVALLFQSTLYSLFISVNREIYINMNVPLSQLLLVVTRLTTKCYLWNMFTYYI